MNSIKIYKELISAECLDARRDDNIARAAFRGNLAAVRGHLRRDRRCLDQLFDGRAALHRAAQNDRTGAIVEFLLAQGAAVDVVDFLGPGAQGEPPLGAAVGGASDVRGGRGCTPLHIAALHGVTENAQLLLAAKASVDIKSEYGWGPQPMSQSCWKKMVFTGKRIE